ncbi:MAG: DNA-binding protein [Acidobacteria bacterium]|nr:DNA-binding protein [Acidobacteriota bacterium]
MKLKSFTDTRPHFLVFDKGDEVVHTLRNFAQEHSIRGGRFAAIGAFQRAVVAFWNPDKRDYDHISVGEQVEVLSLMGDIALEGDDTKIHAHVVLGRRDGSTIGGHLIEGHVFPTLEMHLLDYRSELRREKDESTKLSLIAIKGASGGS